MAIIFAIGQWPDCDYDIDVPGEIKSGESVSFDWEPLIWISGCNNFTQAKFGVYRLLISYQIREGNLSENWAWQTVYSNEFYIEKEKALQYIPTNIENVIITLETGGGCMAGCPNYNLTIYGNGTVIYEGHYFVNITGKHITNISEEKIQELISYFEEIDYFSLNSLYGYSGILDVPYDVTSLTINGKTKSINNDGTDAPRGLTELPSKIDEIVNSSQWID